MKNRNMPAKPLSGDAYTDFAAYDESRNGSSYNPECQGLTKLEYAAIHIMSNAIASSNYIDASDKELIYAVINSANELFDELEKQEQE